MIKYIIKGMLFTLGILIMLWLLSKIGILGFGGTIKEALTTGGNMFHQFGDFLIKIGGGK